MAFFLSTPGLSPATTGDDCPSSQKFACPPFGIK
jgi:hypothetical protein